MTVSPTYPGVYLTETTNIPHTVTPATTNLTAFIGAFAKGPVNEAVLVTSDVEFVSLYGGQFAGSLASYAVAQFFLNGGIGAWIVRVAPPVAVATATGGGLTFSALSPGASANGTKVAVTVDNDLATLTVTLPGATDAAETLAKLPTVPADFVNAVNGQSKQVTAAVAGTTATAVGAGTVTLAGGNGAFTATGSDPVWSLSFTAIDAGATANGTTVAVAVDNGTATVTVTPAGKPAAEVLTNLPTAPADFVKAVNEKSKQVTAAAAGTVGTTVTPATATLAGGTDAAKATGSAAIGTGLSFGSSSPGAWANGMQVNVSLATPIPNGSSVATLVVTPPGSTTPLESLSNLPTSTLAAFATAVNERSQYVTVDATTAAVVAALPGPVTLSNGADGVWAADTFTDAVETQLGNPPAGSKSPPPLPALDRIAPQVFNLMCIPDAVWLDNAVTLYQIAAKFCAARQAFLIADPPPPGAATAPAAFGAPPTTIDSVGVPHNLSALLQWAADLLTPDYDAGAMYYPWLQVPDPLNQQRPIYVPPSGTIAGLYAATDVARGVWKAPAGTLTGLTGVTSLADSTMNDDVNGQLNVVGLNCLRTFPVYGLVVWGARTLAGSDLADSPFKYVPVRRLTDFIEQSLQQSLRWAVFEPNAAPLWASISLEVGSFMSGLYAAGAFGGATAAQAYTVVCDATTTSPTDMLEGIVNVQVGFQPVYPAEFVILNVALQAGTAAS